MTNDYSRAEQNYEWMKEKNIYIAADTGFEI